MRLTLSRTKVPTQRTAEDAVVPARPRYEVADVDGRLDLTCTTCHRSIAVGVRADRLDDDGPFFLEAHAPYCLRVSR